MSKPTTWWGKALLVLPLRLRCVILLTALFALGWVPLVVAIIECFWSAGFMAFMDELEDDYRHWFKAVRKVYRALIEGAEQ